MSLLTITNDDLKPGRGRPLPDRVWKGTGQVATVADTPNGSRVELRHTAFRDRDDSPTITLPNGDTYTPGKRIVFDRQWIDHQNAKAAEIGQRMLKRLAVSSGLVKPVNGKPVEVDFESWQAFAEALQGRDIIVRTKQVRAQTKNAAGVYVDAFETADGETTDQAETDGVANTPKINVEVADYLSA